MRSRPRPTCAAWPSCSATSPTRCSDCATAGGSKPPRAGIEKSVTAKAELVAALKEGVTYCNTVFDGMTDQKGSETVPFVFGPTPRLSVLYFAVSHTYEHYGNLVTYMRLKNIVPPSSETPPLCGRLHRLGSLRCRRYRGKRHCGVASSARALRVSR